jgi:hypothetical protein
VTERDRRVAALRERMRERMLEQMRQAPLPGEAEAAARNWPLVEAAFAEHAAGSMDRSGGGGRRPLLRLALVTALVAAGLAAALSPAGAAVGDWIGDRLGDEPDRGTPAFAALPKGGSVLAISGTGAYAIRPDGNTRNLGPFTEAGWSPRGLHVVGADGRRLTAVDSVGTIKWVLARPGRVHNPAWSTDQGFVVAYLEGAALRAVAGNGDPATDRVLRRDAAPVTPAWQPHSDRVLTYARAGGAIETLDVVTGRSMWRAPAPASMPARALAWSANGRRLVVLSPRSLTELDASGRVVRTIPLPGVARELALHPSGRRAAVVVSRGAETSVLELSLREAGTAPATRQLFQGDLDGIAWSADGRRLLVGWRGAGQWLLIGPGERIRALHGVAAELGVRGGFPRVAGWCCAG